MPWHGIHHQHVRCSAIRILNLLVDSFHWTYISPRLWRRAAFDLLSILNLIKHAVQQNRFKSNTILNADLPQFHGILHIGADANAVSPGYFSLLFDYAENFSLVYTNHHSNIKFDLIRAVRQCGCAHVVDVGDWIIVRCPLPFKSFFILKLYNFFSLFGGGWLWYSYPWSCRRTDGQINLSKAFNHGVGCFEKGKTHICLNFLNWIIANQ